MMTEKKDKKLIKQLLGNDMDSAKAACKKITELKMKSASPYLLKVLKETDDHGLRNSVAIAVMDLKVEEAFDEIGMLLSSPKVHNHRGTPLYVLNEIGGDPSKFLNVLIDIICHGNWEEIREAGDLIFKIKEPLNSELKRKILDKLNSRVEDLDDGHVENINRIIDHLNGEDGTKEMIW